MLIGKLEPKEEGFLPLVEIQTSIWLFPQSTATTVSVPLCLQLQITMFYSSFFLPVTKGKKPNTEEEVPSC